VSEKTANRYHALLSLTIITLTDCNSLGEISDTLAQLIYSSYLYSVLDRHADSNAIKRQQLIADLGGPGEGTK
jgi:hypothetical protein